MWIVYTNDATPRSDGITANVIVTIQDPAGDRVVHPIRFMSTKMPNTVRGMHINIAKPPTGSRIIVHLYSAVSGSYEVTAYLLDGYACFMMPAAPSRVILYNNLYSQYGKTPKPMQRGWVYTDDDFSLSGLFDVNAKSYKTVTVDMLPIWPMIENIVPNIDGIRACQSVLDARRTPAIFTEPASETRRFMDAHYSHTECHPTAKFPVGFYLTNLCRIHGSVDIRQCLLASRSVLMEQCIGHIRDIEHDSKKTIEVYAGIAKWLMTHLPYVRDTLKQTNAGASSIPRTERSGDHAGFIGAYSGDCENLSAGVVMFMRQMQQGCVSHRDDQTPGMVDFTRFIGRAIELASRYMVGSLVVLTAPTKNRPRSTLHCVAAMILRNMIDKERYGIPATVIIDPTYDTTVNRDVRVTPMPDQRAEEFFRLRGAPTLARCVYVSSQQLTSYTYCGTFMLPPYEEISLGNGQHTNSLGLYSDRGYGVSIESFADGNFSLRPLDRYTTSQRDAIREFMTYTEPAVWPVSPFECSLLPNETALLEFTDGISTADIPKKPFLVGYLKMDSVIGDATYTECVRRELQRVKQQVGLAAIRVFPGVAVVRILVPV